MKRVDIEAWLKSWPEKDMPIEVRREGSDRVVLVAVRVGHITSSHDSVEFPLVIGAYPDKVEV